MIFLVDGQCFFVDSLLLFAGNLQAADGALQLRSGDFKFLLKVGYLREVALRGGTAALRLVLRRFNKTDQQKFVVIAPNRLDVELNETGCPSWLIEPPATTTRTFS